MPNRFITHRGYSLDMEYPVDLDKAIDFVEHMIADYENAAADKFKQAVDYYEDFGKYSGETGPHFYDAYQFVDRATCMRFFLGKLKEIAN